LPDVGNNQGKPTLQHSGLSKHLKAPFLPPEATIIFSSSATNHMRT